MAIYITTLPRRKLGVAKVNLQERIIFKKYTKLGSLEVLLSEQAEIRKI